MASKTLPLVWNTCRGRDGWNSPLAVSSDMATEVLNMHFYEGQLGTKRFGATNVAISGVAGISGPYNALARFVPAQDETAAELFLVDDSGTKKILRMAGGSTVANLTLADNVASNAQLVSAANLNGKLYFAYDSTVNRLHVFDPGYSTTTVRRGGFATPAAPTGATLGGAGLTFTGTYRVAYTEQRSSVTVRRSLLSASVAVSITDDSGIQVTKPAAISEGETHWELYRLHTDGEYYRIATTVVGTTTYDDTSSSVDTTTAAPLEGANTPFPSVKFLYSDGTRLFGLGVWETSAGDSHTPRAGRVYLSPALDASEIHDDERCSNTVDFEGTVDLSRNGGGLDRGINGLGNTVFAFQSLGIYALLPTENPNIPYRRVVYSTRLGAVSHASIIQAEDAAGRPALYFLDPALGPYRITLDGGLQWCGKDVKDIWDTVNLAASSVVAHGVYHKAKQQIWWWVATGASNDPDTMIVFDVTLGTVTAEGVVTGGWAKWGGNLASSRCSVMMSTTLGATMSRDQKPYSGQAVSGTALFKGDVAGQLDDNGTAFQAYIQSKAYDGGDLTLRKAVRDGQLVAEAASAVTITQTFLRNFGDETNRTDTRLLTAAGSESLVVRKFEAGQCVDAHAFQVRLGDGSAAANNWTLHGWTGRVEGQGEF